MNNQEFLLKVKQNIATVFNQLENKEEIFEFGIATDSDVSTMHICYNTYTHFAADLEYFFIKYHEILDTRWNTPEWVGEIGDENSLIKEVNEILYNIIRPQEFANDEDNFDDIILDIFCNALFELKNEGLFNEMGKAGALNEMDNGYILYLERVDYPVTSKQKERILKLVGEKYYQVFLYEGTKFGDY